MNKYKYLVSLLVACALLLGACQQTATPAEAPSPTEPVTEAAAPGTSVEAATEVPAEKDGEVITLAFWTLLGGANGERVQKLVDDFNASQDGIVIVNESQGGYDDLQQKLLAALAAGNPPPITMVDYKNVPFYAKNGAFEADQ